MKVSEQKHSEHSGYPAAVRLTTSLCSLNPTAYLRVKRSSPLCSPYPSSSLTSVCSLSSLCFSLWKDRLMVGWGPLSGRSRSGPFTGMVGDPPGAVEAENSPFRARSGRSGDSCKLGNSGGADMRRSRKTSDGQLALGDPPVRRLNHQLDPADEADRKRARDRERALRARRRNAKAWWLK